MTGDGFAGSSCCHAAGILGCFLIVAAVVRAGPSVEAYGREHDPWPTALLPV
jgi:hypothetical protein